MGAVAHSSAGLGPDFRRYEVPYRNLRAFIGDHLPLDVGTVVYRVDCAAAEALRPDLESTLSPDETADVARLSQEPHRRRMAISRGLLRTVLGIHLNLPAIEVPLFRDSKGRPYLAAHASTLGLQVSCSRSGHLGAFAIARHANVSLDIELVDHGSRFPDHLGPSVLSDFELACFNTAPAVRRERWMARAWVCKETAIKAIGRGLQIDPRALTVQPVSPPVCDPSDEPHPFTVDELPGWAGLLERRGGLLTAVLVQGSPSLMVFIDVRF